MRKTAGDSPDIGNLRNRDGYQYMSVYLIKLSLQEQITDMIDLPHLIPPLTGVNPKTKRP